MQKQPRKNKSKAELQAELDHKAKIDHQKTVARLIFPFIEDQPTIYDAQTVVNAAAGYIKYGTQQKAIALSVKDLSIDLSKEPVSPLKTAVENVLNLLQDENADGAVALLERFGSGLGQYASVQYMKNPMNIIPVDEFIA